MEKKRNAWLDVARAIGIFAIYLGHSNESAGLSFQFVYRFHLPLFFFLSGCTENFNKESRIGRKILKNVYSLLIPAFFFAFLSLIIYVIEYNSTLENIKLLLVTIAKGLIRNTYFASTLWFLTCLFSIKCFGAIIQKAKYKGLMLLIAFGSYFIAEFIIMPNPTGVPHSWYYNLDSAFYYIHYYIAGLVFFPYIEKIFQLDKRWKQFFIWVIGIGTFIYSAFLFFGIDIINIQSSNEGVMSVVPVYRAYLIIVFVVVMAYVFRKADRVAFVGRNSLYLCGNEYIIKTLVICFFDMLGLTITLFNPLAAYIYTTVLVLGANYILTPVVKPMLNTVTGKIKSIICP